MEYVTVIANTEVKWTCPTFDAIMPESIKDIIAGCIRKGQTSGAIGDLQWEL